MRLKLLAAGTALAVLLAAPSSRANSVAKPFLWKACDADSCIYLLGTFHALKAEDTRVAPEVEAAQSASDRFFFEVNPKETENAAVAGMAFLRAAIREDGSRLNDDLTPALQKKLSDVIDRHGKDSEVLALLSGEGRQQLELWYVALLLTLTGVERGDLDPEFGLDKQMEGRLAKENKQVFGLESVQDQVDVFDALSKKEQVQLLEEALDSMEKGPAEFAKMRKSWLEGDEQASWMSLGASTKKSYPDLYKRIQVDRNTRWMDKIEGVLSEMKEGNAMVIVGTLHLLGEDSVVAMLKKKGYSIERICKACKTQQ